MCHRRCLTFVIANHILSYRLPPEREDFTLTPEEQQERGLASSSNARIFPPPLFSRYDMPINYKQVTKNGSPQSSTLIFPYSFKPNPSSVQQTVVDKVTGETTTRLVNTNKQVDGHPISIRWNEPVSGLRSASLVTYDVLRRQSR